MAAGCDSHHSREVNGRVTLGRRHHLVHRAGSEGLPAVAAALEALPSEAAATRSRVSPPSPPVPGSGARAQCSMKGLTRMIAL